MGRLDDRVAIVTGGAAGIGAGIAERLVAEGATVVIADLDQEAAAATATRIGAHHLVQDVSDETRWDEVVAETIARHGSVDILVNNAGILGTATQATPEHTTLADWRRIFAVNAEGVFLGCRAMLRALIAAGRPGSIVNIGSSAGVVPTSTFTAYGASKAAVAHLTRSVAQYGRSHGIRCNAILPGNVDTPLHEQHRRELAAAGVAPESVGAWEPREPTLGGWIPREQVAAAVCYLASDDAAFVTGESLLVDGGALLR